MWKIATFIFVALGVISVVVTEFLRSILDRKRRERDGLGGTQDIAIGGMIFGWLCVLGAMVCGAAWVFNH